MEDATTIHEVYYTGNVNNITKERVGLDYSDLPADEYEELLLEHGFIESNVFVEQDFYERFDDCFYVYYLG